MSAENNRFKPSETQPLPKEIEKFFNQKNSNIVDYIRRCQNNDEFEGKQLIAFAGGAALMYQTIERKGGIVPEISKDAVYECHNAKNRRLENNRDMVTEWLGEWKEFTEEDPELSRRVFNVGIAAGFEEEEFIAFQGGSGALHSLIKEENAIKNVSNEIEIWLQGPK